MVILEAVLPAGLGLADLAGAIDEDGRAAFTGKLAIGLDPLRARSHHELDLAELREALSQYRHPAVVPTMGNLHAGHLALVRQAKPLGDVTISTIFVNRLQFAPHEDFDTYPRTLEADCEHLEAAGCDIVFAPKESELYPQAQTFKVHPPTELADILEGHFRPGFFIEIGRAHV